MKWLTFDRAWMLGLVVFAVGGWAAITNASDRNQAEQFEALRGTVAALSGEIKGLAGADAAKTLELTRFDFRVQALESKNKVQDDLLELHRIQLENMKVTIAVEAAKRGG